MSGPHADASPTPDAVAEELASERRFGSTEAGRATNKALNTLSKTSRSFRFYDPRNEAIRGFLGEYGVAMRRALDDWGALDLAVRPFEMTRDGEVVYQEMDRTRSLAFRLFRDGVRRVVVEPEVEQDELMKLLEILSIRFTGIRQQEDDVVTMLRKAQFAHIDVTAVEGFVLDDETESSAAGDGDAGAESTPHVDAPRDWDQPFVQLPGPAPLAWQPLHPDLLGELCAEVMDTELPALSLRLLSGMIEAVLEPSDPTQLSEVLPYVHDLRDFLRSEGHCEGLLGMLHELLLIQPDHPDEVAALQAELVGGPSFEQILEALPPEQEFAPRELVDIIELCTAFQMPVLVELLGSRPTEEGRAVVLDLVRHFVPERMDDVVAAIADVPPDVGMPLLDMMVREAPERAMELALEAIRNPDPEVQVRGVQWMRGIPYSGEVGRTLVGLMEAPEQVVRIAAIETLGAIEEPRAFEVMKRLVERRAPRDLAPEEANALGRAMARIEPNQASQLFGEWIRSKGFFGRFVDLPGREMLRWTAVAGYEVMLDEEADELLRWLAKKAGAELARHCNATQGLRVKRRAQLRAQERARGEGSES